MEKMRFHAATRSPSAAAAAQALRLELLPAEISSDASYKKTPWIYKQPGMFQYIC